MANSAISEPPNALLKSAKRQLENSQHTIQVAKCAKLDDELLQQNAHHEPLVPLDQNMHSSEPGQREAEARPSSVLSATQPENAAAPPAAISTAEPRKLTPAEKDAQKEERRKARQLALAAERERKELERQQEKHLRETKRKEEKERKERERQELKARKDQERAEELLRKKQEKEEELQRKEQEKEEKRKAKEAEKESKRQLREDTSQRTIGTFFVQKVAPTKNDTPEVSLDDYSQTFLPFHLKSNMIAASIPSKSSEVDPMTWLRELGARSTNLPTSSARQIYQQIALLQDETEAAQSLEKLQIRHLQFSENIRPPYVGTAPEITSDLRAEILRNPGAEILPGIDYSFDSDCEWMLEDEEGEDLDEEDDSEEEDEDESMDEFVSDEEGSNLTSPNSQANPVASLGRLVPVVIWHESDDCSAILSKFAAVKLFDCPDLINTQKQYSTSTKSNLNSSATPDAQTVSENSIAINPVLADLSAELIKGILKEIHGSRYNQVLLVELIHERFPEVTRNQIKSVLKACAKRPPGVGKIWAVHANLCMVHDL